MKPHAATTCGVTVKAGQQKGTYSVVSLFSYSEMLNSASERMKCNGKMPRSSKKFSINISFKIIKHTIR